MTLIIGNNFYATTSLNTVEYVNWEVSIDPDAAYPTQEYLYAYKSVQPG